MKDLFKRGRKSLRPKWTSECPGKGIKGINRKAVRAKLKAQLRKET